MERTVGYTYFGRVVLDLMEDRGFDQPGLARALSGRGHGDFAQQEISTWLRTPNVPHYAPGMLADVLDLDEAEDERFRWAYTYGRVHLSDEEIGDVERRLEAYRELRRRRRKGGGQLR